MTTEASGSTDSTSRCLSEPDLVCCILHALGTCTRDGDLIDVVSLSKGVAKVWATAARRLLCSEAYAELVPLSRLLFNGVQQAPTRLVKARLSTQTGRKEALTPLDDSATLPLHRVLRQRSTAPATVLDLLECASDAASSWCLPRAFPLHTAAEHAAPVEVVRALLRAFPAGVSHRGFGGRLPLHLGLASNAPAEAVLAILAAHPDAARQKTGDAKEGLPLHLACAAGADSTVVRALLKAHPDAAVRFCGSVGLPLHAAIIRACSSPAAERGSGEDEAVKTVRALLAAAPEMARVPRRSDGLLPLHLAACTSSHSSSPATAAVAAALLDRHPLTPEWTVEQLLLARRYGEARLLRALPPPNADVRTVATVAPWVLVAFRSGAPDHVMRAVAIGVASPEEAAPDDVREWCDAPIEGLLAMSAGKPPSREDEPLSDEDAGGTAPKPDSQTRTAQTRHGQWHPNYYHRAMGSEKAPPMGIGGSYVLPPTRIAEIVIGYFEKERGDRVPPQRLDMAVGHTGGGGLHGRRQPQMLEASWRATADAENFEEPAVLMW